MSSSSPRPSAARRDFLKTGAAALTASFFPGAAKGANDKVNIAFIGTGAMGSGNIGYASKVPGFQITHVCDVYQTNLEKAQALARRNGFESVKAVRDFREILADKSVDAVCISAPDHWHPYMTVEACKAGKDVYVEKPACVYVEEGQKMVQAARKYNRVVQAGTMQRSGAFFQKAREIVKSGDLGDVTFVRTFQSSLAKKAGWGKPADAEPPAGLDWDLWLGPAPKRPFNLNRWGIAPGRWSTFRYFWDYAGGAMTDWGVHLLDIVQFAYDEAMPKAITAQGGKFFVDDNVETPDTMLATFYYPGFIGNYESRTCNPMQMYGDNYGTAFHGTNATLFVNRGGYKIFPNEKGAQPTEDHSKAMTPMNVPHWENFIACIRSRQRPTSDIETCVRTTATCLLANISMRNRIWLDWDDKTFTVKQPEAKKHLKLHYRSPWKLEV
jgi:predicted dehydrogenase